jgi:hypothetical protein
VINSKNHHSSCRFESGQGHDLGPARMPNDYAYSVSQCDVPIERRNALQSYRGKRKLWLSWIDTDEHHAIWDVISSMVWRDAAFKALMHFALANENNGLNNPLLADALVEGHIATQVLAIRRLVDKSRNTISVRRLITDLKGDFALFTRENCVCFDGLLYDYEAVQQREMVERLKSGSGSFWEERSGPNAHTTSCMMHRQFDELTGIDPAKRSREDRLPISLLTTIERWLDESEADGLAEWSHAFLAHAGGPELRKKIADQLVTADKITKAIATLARVTEATSRWLLFASGRTNSLMPVARFNPFEKLDAQIMDTEGLPDAWTLWNQLSDERNHYLDGVVEALMQPRRKTPAR